MGETAPFWRFSAASYPDLEATIPIDAISDSVSKQVIEKQTNGHLIQASGVRTRCSCTIYVILHFSYSYLEMVSSF